MRRTRTPSDAELADKDRRGALIVMRDPARYRDYPGLLRWARETLGIPAEATTNAPEATERSGEASQQALDFGVTHES